MSHLIADLILNFVTINYLMRPHQEDDLLKMRPWRLENTKCPCRSLSWALGTV